MKIAYFDCHFGAAGDMLNAALLAAGLDEKKWQAELKKVALPAGSVAVKVSKVSRCNLASLKMDVCDSSGVKFDQLYHTAISPQLQPESAGKKGSHAARTRARSGKVSHAHDHDHGHTHAHDEHEHSHGAGHKHTHTVGNQLEHSEETRHLADILRLIERSDISARAKDLASRIFMRLANAESKVHGVAPEDVHFHEVGAVDAIVDVVGFAIGYDLMQIEKSYCSAVAIGSGRVRTEHGIYPVPGPATTYLLQDAGAAIASSDIEFECLTPTGAAILCEIAASWGHQPAFERVTSTGYGAGSKDTKDHPNVCRVVLGEVGETAVVVSSASPSSLSEPSSRFSLEAVSVLEANLDDISPQTLAYAMDRLLEAGALDVTLAPVVMKKSRPGQILTVLCRPADATRLQEMVLDQTSSLGVRSYSAERLCASRQWQNVTLKSGMKVRIKLAKDKDGKVINAQPEFEDCAECARATGRPLKDVMAEAMKQYGLHCDRG